MTITTAVAAAAATAATTTTTTTTTVIAWLSVPAMWKEWLDGKKEEDEQLKGRVAGVDP